MPPFPMRTSLARRHHEAPAWVVFALLSGLGLVGCGDDPELCVPPPTHFSRTLLDYPNVDLLLVIDNSSGMREEQASLAAELPRLFTALSTGLNPQTGQAFPPVQSLRVGVISSDLGTGPNGACDSALGDDGVLLTAGNGDDPSCSATYPSWLDFAYDSDGVDTFAADARCVLTAVGTDGCGFQQPLDAMLKALMPSTSGVTFQDGHVGHGDGQNLGFLRADSLLAILALTDEDDCSAIDPDFFASGHPAYDPNLNLRCHLHPEALQPVSRYVDGLLHLRQVDPGSLLYAAIVGVPPDLVPDPAEPLAPQVTDLLADPRMVERVDPMDQSRLAASCATPEHGEATPPRRMVQLAAELDAAGARGVVHSVCRESLAGAVDAFIGEIADWRSPPRCFTHRLIRDPSGRVPCEVIELIDPEEIESCEALPGRVADGFDEATGRPRCVVRQLATDGATPPPSEPAGWYFDDFSAESARRCGRLPRIAYTDGAAPPLEGVEEQMECVLDAGTPCGPDAPPNICDELTPWALGRFPLGLACETHTTQVCLPLCHTDADCGLGGLVCVDGPEAGQRFCVDPICR